MKEKIVKWLIGDKILQLDCRIEMIETLILHYPSRMHGYGVLKRHLQPPNKPLPRFGGKEIDEQ